MQPTKKPKPKPRSILVDTLPTTVDKPPTSRFTLEGDVRPRRAKVTNSASTDLQSSLNTQEACPTTLQNFTSGIAKLENLFANEIATYTSIATGIDSQYFFLYDKIRHLEAGNSFIIIWRIPSEVCVRLCKSSPTII